MPFIIEYHVLPALVKSDSILQDLDALFQSIFSSNERKFLWPIYRWSGVSLSRIWRLGLFGYNTMEKLPNCLWVSLEETVFGYFYHTHCSKTSGSWALGQCLSNKENSLRLLYLLNTDDLKLKLCKAFPRSKWHYEVDSFTNMGNKSPFDSTPLTKTSSCFTLTKNFQTLIF